MNIAKMINYSNNLSGLEKTIVAIGALDVIYIAWILLSSVLNLDGALPDIWRNLQTSDVQSPLIMMSAIMLFNSSLFICGAAMLIRNKNFILLNYLHLPFRLLMGVPTLYPLFAVISWLNIELSGISILVSMLFMETFRVALVKKWQKTENV